MAKWDFKIVGASFVKELVPVDGDVNPRSQSFMQPSFDWEGDKIVMKESGQYKTAITFSQIGEIDGVAPTDLEDAYEKLLTLVENFNGGGGTPQTLQQVLDQGSTAIDNSIALTSTSGPESASLNYNQLNVFDTDYLGTLKKNILQFLDIIQSTTTNYGIRGFQFIISGSASTDVSFETPTALNSIVIPDQSGTIELATVATTGSVIAFVRPQIYNSIASPSSSNITDSLTGARIGVVQKIYHNAGTAPTFPAGWVKRGTGSYVTSTLNIIYAEWSVGTTVEYWITQ
jgi:hypothetical protein